MALIEPMIRPTKRGGRPRTVNVREVLNAIFYVLSTGCQWQALPKDLPPKSRRLWRSSASRRFSTPTKRGTTSGRASN
jgi:transposase